MITVTPANEHYTRSYQDCDEKQALLSDLHPHARDYLSHKDATVRSLADWTMEYYKIRNMRWSIQANPESARHYLGKLYQRLRTIAAA